MKDNQRYNELREQQWRRPLTPAEEAELRSHARAAGNSPPDWESDAALTRLLSALPDVPVSSNFTALAVQAAVRNSRSDRRRQGLVQRLWEQRWRILPRTAFAAVLLSAGLIVYTHTQNEQRKLLIEGISTVAQVAAIPGPELLQDYEAIRALNPTPAADDELLRLLQ